jgi:hypothetical protein
LLQKVVTLVMVQPVIQRIVLNPELAALMLVNAQM